MSGFDYRSRLREQEELEWIEEGEAREREVWEEAMSIGADLPQAPVQCPVCRRWLMCGDMRNVVAKATDQPEHAIVVCAACYEKVSVHGTIRVLVHGETWMIGLIEGPSAPVR